MTHRLGRALSPALGGLERMRFTGHIAGAGTASGTRLVLGCWVRTPHGPFADVMVEHPDGHRQLLAPDEWVADFVSSTYRFDEVLRTEIQVSREPAEGVPGGAGHIPGNTGRGSRWSVRAGPLAWDFTVGRRDPLGWLLRAVPAPLSRTLTLARMSDPIARVVMRGVRTLGTAGGGRTEWYSATDLHRMAKSSASWNGTDLGVLAEVLPAPSFGFGSTPATPGVTSLTTTVRLPKGQLIPADR